MTTLPANKLSMFHWHVFEVTDASIRAKLDRMGVSPFVVVRSMPGGFQVLAEGRPVRRVRKAEHLTRFIDTNTFVRSTKERPARLPWEVDEVDVLPDDPSLWHGGAREARAEVEAALHAAGIIEDSDLDGGLLG